MAGVSRWRLWRDRGTVRPPFQLIVFCRPRWRFSLLPCVGSYCPWGDKPGAHESKTLTYLDHRGETHRDTPKTPRPKGARYECYLWPDRLRWHFFVWGLLIGLVVGWQFEAPWLPSLSLVNQLILAVALIWTLITWLVILLIRRYRFKTKWHKNLTRTRRLFSPDGVLVMLASLVLALLFYALLLFCSLLLFRFLLLSWAACRTEYPFAPCGTENLLQLLDYFNYPVSNATIAITVGLWVLLVFIMPWLVYGFAGRPVLVKLRTRWPSVLSKWLTGVIAWHPGKWPDRLLPFIRSPRLYLPAFFRTRDAIDWSPGASARQSLLHVAISELFSDGDNHADPWQSPALRHWLWYWCAPVWCSYLTIVLVLGMVSLGLLCVNTDNDGLQYLRAMVIGWSLYAILFMRAESARLNQWGDVNERMLEPMPAMLRHHVKTLSEIAPSLSRIKALGIFSLINGAAMLGLMRWIKVLST